MAKEELDRLKSDDDLMLSPSCEDFGVAITMREQRVDDLNETVFISGTVESLPPKYQIWIAATGRPGSQGYYPRDTVNIKGTQWDLEIVPGLKTREDKKRFAAFLVGENGQALIEYYRSAMRQVAQQGDEWPALTITALDMARCNGFHEVSLK